MVDINSPREEIVAAWLARLRDPKSKQARGRLRDGRGRRCLGHLCDVVGLRPRHKDGVWYYDREIQVLPERLRAAVGLGSTAGFYDESSGLAQDNDRGKTLPEIADIIESRPPGLFVEEERP